MKSRLARTSQLGLCLSCAALLVPATVVGGCASTIDANVPEPVREAVDPEFQSRYWFYRPSSYDRNLLWPLIVVCASGFPDSPSAQIRDWAQLAERHGFLVLAPTVEGNTSAGLRSPAATAALLSSDERRILAAIQHVQAGHSISEDRVMIYGWSGGSMPALFVGLRNPELFRAIAVVQPKVNDAALSGAKEHVDSHQPVFVYSNSADALVGNPVRACVDWLKTAGANVAEDPMGPARKTDCARAVDFFDGVIRGQPWIRVSAKRVSGEGGAVGESKAEVQFQVRSSFVPAGFRWQFGDGDESKVAEPIHRYSRSGTYRARVELKSPEGRVHERSLEISIP